MSQDSTQKSYLFGMLCIVGIFILTWWVIKKSEFCSNKCWQCDDRKEKYSPYRNTGGCPNSTGWTYQDSYNQEDWYRKYPYIYPTPTNYFKEWYANRRANYRFLNSLREKMRKELEHTNPNYMG